MHGAAARVVNRMPPAQREAAIGVNNLTTVDRAVGQVLENRGPGRLVTMDMKPRMTPRAVLGNEDDASRAEPPSRRREVVSLKMRSGGGQLTPAVEKILETAVAQLPQ